jgi:rSAM/selenodomain-associated transferase 1
MIPELSDIIILFTRYPVPGHCKTRLIPALGPVGATVIHHQMTRRILEQLSKLAAIHPYRLEIHHDSDHENQMRAWLGAHHHYQRQADGDIGFRMREAISSHQGQMRRLLLIGSDCPELSATILQDSFTALNTHDLVLGPAFDGGYYLIGVRDTSADLVCDNLFQDIPWGTDTVCATTLSLAERLQLRCHSLKRLHDIDTPADLKYLHHHPHPQ